jgi:translation initiation factor 4E
VEDFFGIYQHLKRPSTLPLVSDYHIFKKGIRPVWEDDENKRGGKWIVRLKKGVADRYWEDLLLAIVGDQFAEASEEVCGAVLSVRNGEDILSIWTRNNGGRVLKIRYDPEPKYEVTLLTILFRETMKRILIFPPETKVEWKSHDSSIQQRTAIDDARKEKSSQHNHHSAHPRNGSKDIEQSSPEKKQTS